MLILKRKVTEYMCNTPIVVKASIAFMFCTFMQRGISILTTPIFTRLLTTEEYGYYSIFVSWLDVVSVFTTLKLAGGTFTQALVKYEEQKNELLASTAGLATTTTIVAGLIYYLLKDLINPLLGMDTLIAVCAIISSWATLLFDLWAVSQRVEYKYKCLVLITLIISAAKPIAGIIAIAMCQTHKAEARIITTVVVEVACFSWLLFLFLLRGGKYYNKRFWKYSLSLNIPLIPHYLTRTILNQCDRLMINSMLGYSQAGIYSLAYNLAMVLTIVNSSILNSFNPWMYQRIKKEEFDKIGPISYILLEVIAVAGLGLIAISPELVQIFAPSEYYEAIWVIPPVTAGMYFLFMYSLYANFEFYFEKTKFMMFVSTLGGVINVILNYLCIPIWGYISAGYTTLFCYMLYTIAHYWGMKRIIRDHLSNINVYNMKTILTKSIIFLAMSAVFMATYDMTVIRYSLLLLVLAREITRRKAILAVFKAL